MLKIGLPSKGRLQDKTISWFAEREITIERTGLDREYAGRINLDDVEIVLLSAGEIPQELAAGRIHMGVTGQDLVHEKIPLWPAKIAEIAPMGFGFADLILAVPAVWVDVETVDDLDAVAAAFRAKHGFRLRIATKYHNLVREFLREQGVADYQLVDSQGATEGTIKNLTAEAVADITTTGQTLVDNHLRILTDGMILKSQATLFAAVDAPWGAAEKVALDKLLSKLSYALPTQLRG